MTDFPCYTPGCPSRVPEQSTICKICSDEYYGEVQKKDFSYWQQKFRSYGQGALTYTQQPLEKDEE